MVSLSTRLRSEIILICSELLSSYDKTKSDALKQVTCDFIANNLGHIMETPVRCTFFLPGRNHITPCLGLERTESETT